jgi:hypothetical protein
MAITDIIVGSGVTVGSGISITNNGVVTTGMVLGLDAANPSSYPGYGTTWYDISGSGYNFNIVSSAYTGTGPQYMNFGGSYGCAKCASGVDAPINGTVTAVVWTIPLNSTANWRTLFRGLSASQDHQVIIESGTYRIGMYSNDSGSGFNYCGYDQTSLPNYATQWQMMVWTWPGSASPGYYNLALNSAPSTIVGSITSANATFHSGICSIGAYNNGNQTDPTVASQFWGNIGAIYMYNRILSSTELLQIWNATHARYGV